MRGFCDRPDYRVRTGPPDELVESSGVAVDVVIRSGVEGELVESELTTVAKRFPAAETAPEIGIDLTLPIGGVSSRPDPRTGGSSYVGHGMEYIAAVTGLTVAAIETMLANPGNVLHQNGEPRHVIGRTLSEEELIILSIIGGTIYAAGKGYAMDPCGTIVWTTEQRDDVTEDEPWPDDATRDDKPINSLDRVRKLLEYEDLVRIVVGSSQTYYIVQLGTNQFVTFVAKDIAIIGGLLLWTTRWGNGAYFKSIEEALKDIRRYEGGEPDEVIDPETDC